jgi:hypothetical protein
MRPAIPWDENEIARLLSSRNFRSEGSHDVVFESIDFLLRLVGLGRKEARPFDLGSLRKPIPRRANQPGSAIVNATGAIRQAVRGEENIRRRYLVIAEGHPDKPGPMVQVQFK